MKIVQTTIRPAEGGYLVEMALEAGPPDDPLRPYLRFQILVEAHPEGRPPLVELQRAALASVRDAILEQLRDLPSP